MFEGARAFSGFAVKDLDAARAFYADVLGLEVVENRMGFLELVIGPGAHVLIYPKPDHEPANYTIFNIEVDDVDQAVAALHERGVQTKIYEDDDLPTDERGIMRGGALGPDIAWFRDPSGNVLSVLATV